MVSSGMLTPADKGKNATLEYALNGITAYATAPGNEALCADVRKGLVRAIERCADNANRAFLFSQLQLCSAAEDAAWILPYLDDSYLSDYAIRALISTMAMATVSALCPLTTSPFKADSRMYSANLRLAFLALSLNAS